jgi:hypothetical protein
MMDETIPSSSAGMSGAASRRRATDTAASSLPNSGDSSSPRRTAASQEDDDDRSSRRRRFNTSLLLNPAFLLSKAILLINIVLRIVLFPIKKTANILFPPGEYDNLASTAVSDHAAKAFIQMFTLNYIKPILNNMNEDDDASLLECPFIEKGYTYTVNDIANQGQMHNEDGDNNPSPPLLLIYLHSPLHGKVPQFVKNTLCNQRVLELMNQHSKCGTLACWGGSIHTADGAHAKDTLQVASFPFLALVRVQPGRSSSSSSSNQRNLELLFRMEGPALQTINATSLHTHLSNALLKYQGILSEAAMRRMQRQDEVRLRDEQDREYREALEEDQRREKEKLEQKRLQEEEELKIRQEMENVQNEKENRLQNARDMLCLNGEGEPDSSDKSIVQARIRLMLPSGKRVERSFRGNDTIDVVRAFLILHFDENDIGIENFQLSSNYPKKALVDVDKTLDSEGLCPQAVIMVQDLDA